MDGRVARAGAARDARGARGVQLCTGWRVVCISVLFGQGGAGGGGVVWYFFFAVAFPLRVIVDGTLHRRGRGWVVSRSRYVGLQYDSFSCGGLLDVVLLFFLARLPPLKKRQTGIMCNTAVRSVDRRVERAALRTTVPSFYVAYRSTPNNNNPRDPTPPAPLPPPRASFFCFVLLSLLSF